MVSLLGNFALWFSLFISVFQFLSSHYINNRTIFKINKIFTISLLLSSGISFFVLIYAHVVSDFSLINVFQNSHTSKPMLYKFAGVWGNHEGSMLLWIFILTIFNFFIYKLYNEINLILISKALKIQAIIICGFVLFTILTSNPFEKVDVVKLNGLGFNPLLQDPALAIHPPLLYIGYVGFSATFSIGLATLSIRNIKNIPWYLYMKPFVLASWTFLTIGIALGSIWAYYELGWGGWWFWDPVENASFMPWLIGTALLHSLIIVERKRTLQAWVLLLSILSFLLSMIGTFLVRSGILTSVHTFALDPSRGFYILAFATLLSFYSLSLFGLNSKNYTSNNYFSFLSKEGTILINNILMVVVCASVFLGTVYPLLVEAFTGIKISVGEPYYTSTVVPIMIPAILVMGVGPILSWGKENKVNLIKDVLPVILLTLITTILFFLIYKKFSLLGVAGILLSFWIIFNNLTILYKKINFKNKFMRSPLNTKKFSSGMIISHLGIGLLILGITGSSVWQNEKIIKIGLNDSIKFTNYNILFEEISEIKKQNYIAIQGVFLVKDNKNNIIARLRPENRFYPITNTFTNEVSIHSNIFRDLYLVLGDGNINDGWVIKFYNNPLVIWIWIGSITIFLGGIVALSNNLKKIKK